MASNHLSEWRKSRDILASGRQLVTAPATAERTATGHDESHMTLAGRIEKRLEQIRKRRERRELLTSGK